MTVGVGEEEDDPSRPCGCVGVLWEEEEVVVISRELGWPYIGSSDAAPRLPEEATAADGH